MKSKVKMTFKTLGLRKSLFLIGLFFSELCLLIGAFFSRGVLLQNLLFADPQDTFMDFYKVIICGRTPYTLQMIYPPLIHVILSFLGHFIPLELREEGAFAVRDSQIGMTVFFLWTLFQVYLFVILFRKLYDRVNSKRTQEGELLLFLLLFSLPFIFCFERGNSIFLSLIFLLPYILWYQSEDRKYRLFAFLCLSISAAIKIYPAIFGLLLIREKKVKQAFTLALMGIVTFFSPFLLLVGENRNPLKLLSNLQYTTSLYSEIGCGYRHDLNNLFRILGEIFGKDFSTLGNFVVLFTGVIILLIFFISKDIERWKLYALLSLTTILITGMNYTYSIIFMIIPLIFFLNEGNLDNKGIQTLYTLLFLIMFTPILISSHSDLLNNPNAAGWPLTFPAILESISLIVMLLLICIQEIKKLFLLTCKSFF